ncbi:guanylate binding protein, putative [Eimeria tenella]|uniref:Guanylate binding protein, putative n=1 Tax=Eimeria tenella TaxID=5802 RepID=U6KZ23_EIMTE|nr:guanylate binding protein, putative [Eimeria tenella]CDJ43216.1 guanylate binding protein, putative [Eimeria tenella]|eukprot:XP_013233966.1 guanylate binding protein, putative [Eimeria tenella]
MFASPLPPGPDLPSVTSAGAAGFVTSGTESLRRGAEQRQGLKNYPEDNPDGKLTGAYTEGTKLTGTNACPVKRLTSVDVEGSDVNLTASLDTFIAGVQGQRTQNYQTTVTPHSPQPESKDEAGAIHTGSARNPGEGIPGVTRELRRGGTMEGYGRSSYMQSALGSVFPEAYANSYVVPREGEAASLPTTSSYQVVLSDGTSYPSAVFPGVSGRESVTRSQLPHPAAPHSYFSPANVAQEIPSYPYTETIHYAEPATTVSPVTGGTTNYYTSCYRRQFPASPIVADSAAVDDDGVPAVSLPHEKDFAGRKSHAVSDQQKAQNAEAADRPTITSLTEPMLLVDGIMGLPLRGQAPSDRGTALLSNPLAHSRDGRLITTKKKLLPRPMQLIHVNRWDGKEVLTVDEGARRWLAELSTRYVAVISICGELQTGKSGLANLLLDEWVFAYSTAVYDGISRLRQGTRTRYSSQAEVTKSERCIHVAFFESCSNIMSSTVGFAVGSSTAAPVVHKGSRFVQRAESEGKTEGVWVSAVESEGDKDNLVYLVLDFEGIGSRRKTVEHDQRLFTLALLVSHFLVFVTRGAVDSDTLFSLASASAWTQRLRITHGGVDRPNQKPPTPSHGGPPLSPGAKGKADMTSLPPKPGIASSSSSWRAPALLWVLQDFNMSMVDEQQNPLTAGDYLEALLSLSVSRETKHLSKLALGLENPQIRMARQEVSELFEDRDCVALPSPLGQYTAYSQQPPSGQAQTRALESVSVSEFVPLYQRRLAQLRCRVFRDCKGRALDGTALTGIALTRILEKLVEGINEGEVPESVRLLGSIQHDECRRWKQVCEEAFTKDLRDAFQAKLPVTTKELQEGAEQLQRKYLQHFKIHAIGDEEVLRHYKTQLKEKLRRITERAVEENDRHAEWKCRQKAKLLSDKLGIDQKISGKLYMDLQALSDDLNLLRQEYNAEIRGPQHVHQRVLNDYIDQLLSKGAKAVADALKDLARDSERTAALLHQKTMDAERKGDKATKLEQELQNKDNEAEQLRRELEDEREQQTLQEERHKQETKELRRELAEQRETNQRLSALYHSRVMDEDDGYRYGVRRSKHSAVGLNDQPRCFGNKCTIM